MNLDQDQMRKWENLDNKLMTMELTDGRDQIIWGLEEDKKFSGKSLCRKINFGEVISRRMNEVWQSKRSHLK
jgi:hypothetical protein